LPEIVGPTPDATLSGATETFGRVSNGVSVGKDKLHFGSTPAPNISAPREICRARESRSPRPGYPAAAVRGIGCRCRRRERKAVVRTNHGLDSAGGAITVDKS